MPPALPRYVAGTRLDHSIDQARCSRPDSQDAQVKYILAVVHYPI
jgi:hypothetical protein